jgi:hypothetical protein
MKRLTVRQAGQSAGSPDQPSAENGEVAITRRGQEIGRALPVGGRNTMPSHARLRGSMPRMRRISERLVREDRDAR